CRGWLTSVRAVVGQILPGAPQVIGARTLLADEPTRVLSQTCRFAQTMGCVAEFRACFGLLPWSAWPKMPSGHALFV
ncbi:MAG: hypothetical protein NZO58_13770, partial [Gemmataceae bacterium]|nr:hypothetical protein [Gemmataceae bacterium]